MSHLSGASGLIELERPALKIDDPMLALKMEELQLEEDRLEMIQGLPHLYGWDWYPWAYDFYMSTNPVNLLCAANQISKSSTQIRKAIHWATESSIWRELWPLAMSMNMPPNQFWYLYPSRDIVAIEFETKWKLFLPKGKFKTDPKYGWREVWKDGALFALMFNTGVTIYYKTYAQETKKLQAGTVYALFCDEELPEEHLGELMLRLSAVDGYFHMVFTATLGQEFWRRAMEPNNKEEEVYPTAWKREVSLFDCLTYKSGKPSPWTPERIKQKIALCGTKADIQKRIYGRFVVVGGLKYESFERARNMIPGHPLPRDWNIYGAADYGSGGEEGHPAACVFVAVDPAFRKGRVFKAWRGDGITTTAGDVVHQFLNMQGNMQMAGRYYDAACKDFDTISTGMAQPFEKAEKAHEFGENLLNVLFKNSMLALYEGDAEIEKLAAELTTLKNSTPKNKAADNLCDAVRYAVSQVPWDLTGIMGIELEVPVELDPILTEEEQRRLGTEELTPAQRAQQEMNAEFEELNHLYAGT